MLPFVQTANPAKAKLDVLVVAASTVLAAPIPWSLLAGAPLATPSECSWSKSSNVNGKMNTFLFI
jgi:hypothetical protein